MLLKRLSIGDYLTDDRERRNARISIIDGMLYAVMGGLTQPFWGAFTVRLGASDYMIALLSSLPALAGLVAQVPSALLIDRYNGRLRPTLISAFAERVFFLLFALVPFMPVPDAMKPLTFVLLFAARNLPATMSGIAWTSMMGEMFSPAHRGRLFGERNMLCTLATLLSTLAAGPVLDRIPWPWNYASLYLVSLGVVMGSEYMLTKHEEPGLTQDERERAPSGVKALKSALRDRRFLRYLLAVMAMHVGFQSTGSLWTILWVKIMGLSNAWLGMFSVASGVASFLSYRAWGRLSEKYGHMTILAVSAVAHIIVPPIYAHFPSAYVYLALNAFSGLIGAGFNLSVFNALLDVSPSSGRPAYIAYYNMVVGLSTFAWPFFGVWLYTRLGMTLALDIATVMRALGMLAAALLLLGGKKASVQEDRPAAQKRLSV